MSMLSEHLTAVLGPEVEDPDEETFLLFANDRPAAQNLGFVDPHAAVLDLTVAGRDLAIHQSPAVLTSSRPGGTTGAVLWKITPAVAEWLARPGNFLFSDGPPLPSPSRLPPLLGPQSAVLELGCGISAVVGLVLTGAGSKTDPSRKTGGKKRTRKAAAAAPNPCSSNNNLVGHYVLTDQPYVAKLLQRNLEANSAARSSLYFHPLDWETDVITCTILRPPPPENAPSVIDKHNHHGHHHPTTTATTPPAATSFDAVLACDCIYNDALVAPLVQTFADACRLRSADQARQNADQASGRDAELLLLPPTLCIVAQQLREPDVLTTWLAEFHATFRVWRIPEAFLTEALRPTAGFAVHVGILR